MQDGTDIDHVVSILAPRRRGACIVNSTSVHSFSKFQSSLPVAGERVSSELLKQLVCAVSILAPRRRGACRAAARLSSPATGFNPRSPSPGSVSARSMARYGCRTFQSSLPVAGERVCRAPTRRPAPRWVSILAPRRRGACFRHVVPGCWCDRFNPRSPSPGSVCPPAPQRGGKDAFQSSLPVAGERVRRPRHLRLGVSGFNPRSPSPGSVFPCPYCNERQHLFQSSLPVAGERVRKPTAPS